MKRAAVVLKVLLLVVVLAFVASTAWDLGQQWQRAPPVRLASGWLVVSVLPVAGVSLCQAVGWRSLLVRLAGRSLPWLASIELLLASMLGRYAPAKVGMPAILMSRAEQLTLTPAVMASSMVLNVLVYSLLGVGLGGLAMAAAGAQGSIPGMPRADVVGGLALAATVGAIAVLLTVDRRRLPAMVLRVLGVQGSGPLIGVPVVGWTTVVWTCWWVHGVVLVMAVGGSVDDGVRTAWLTGAGALGALGTHPLTDQDAFSAWYQLGLALRAVRDIGRLEKGARESGKTLPTVALDVLVRFASAAERNAFAEELMQAIATLVEKYHDTEAPHGREFRFYAGAYPKVKET